MDIKTLKTDLHKFIDQIENRQILKDYYDDMKSLIEHQNDGAWDNLSEDQKQELLIAYEESEDEQNLVDHEAVMKKYEKWL
ncbi:MAG: hypothetical protein IH598_08410 [Bacteroidales bacterium]|nr:hypothetical protein [Bacteroidales bacterium]